MDFRECTNLCARPYIMFLSEVEWNLSNIPVFIKIPVVPKKATCSFLYDYMWPMVTGKDCKVILVVTFSFD